MNHRHQITYSAERRVDFLIYWLQRVGLFFDLLCHSRRCLLHFFLSAALFSGCCDLVVVPV